MNREMFRAQINDGWSLLRKLRLGEERRAVPCYREIDGSGFRHKGYREKWQICYEKRLFDFQLIDGALVQFRMLGSSSKFSVTYVYYDCPYDILTYKGFLEKEGIDYRVAGGLLREEYEEYILSCDLKKGVIPIRYDFDVESYEEGIHPTSHVHIGEGNNLRLGAEKVWKPISFILFIIRQCYPKEWMILVDMAEAVMYVKNVRESLEKAPFMLESEIDKMEVILT